MTVVSINHSVEKDTNLLPRSYDVISPGDDIAVVGREKNIRRMAEEFGWVIKEDLDTFSETLSRTNAGMCETIISPRSELSSLSSMGITLGAGCEETKRGRLGRASRS